jgi:xanthosine utilization system XapX-like protein
MAAPPKRAPRPTAAVWKVAGLEVSVLLSSVSVAAPAPPVRVVVARVVVVGAPEVSLSRASEAEEILDSMASEAEAMAEVASLAMPEISLIMSEGRPVGSTERSWA